MQDVLRKQFNIDRDVRVLQTLMVKYFSFKKYENRQTAINSYEGGAKKIELHLNKLLTTL